jgi:D-alanyl-D-alanine carboxypeptidase (penicillin-binding protein 5/6)
MSVRDLAIISRRLILDFPQYYRYFSEREFMFKPDIDGNKDNNNKLLWIMPGADGLGVGHTTRGGYGMAASITRGNRRLIAVTGGLKTPNANFERYLDARALLEYGLKAFSNFVFYDKGQEIIRIPVWYGAKSHIAVGSTRPVMVTAPAGSNPSGELTVTYLSPAVAPVRKGDKLGTVVLFVDGKEAERYDLVALKNMRRAMLLGRTWENIKQLVLKVWR